MIRMMGEIWQLGHKAVEELFDGQVEIQEKIDGSFFSWQLTKEGELEMRSKGQELFDENPSAKMFKPVMDAVRARKDFLTPGFVYRGEAVCKPKHNTLAYDRVPNGNVVLFDIEMSLGSHAGSLMRNSEAVRMGFTPVPVLFEGYSNAEHAMSFLETNSILGGQKVEGVVIKNTAKFHDKQILQAKYVSPSFREKHATEWKNSNPNKKDVIEGLIDVYKHENRWKKAIQHLRDNGQLDGSPKDIGPLMKEISSDVLKEEEAAIKEALWKLAWPQISRGVTRGFPDWYKEQLALGGLDNDGSIG